MKVTVGAMLMTEETINPKTGMTLTETKEFIRNHFEEFVNHKNMDIADVNFAPDFEDHGDDVPPGTAPARQERNNMLEERTRSSPISTLIF